MEDQLISFETAKLAKEKGFNLECRDVYATSEFYPKIHNWQKGLYKEKTFGGDFARLNWKGEEFLNTPTQPLLQKWLRDEYGTNIIVSPSFTCYNIEVLRYSESHDQNEVLSLNGLEHKDFTSYEEALEKGLLKALELI